MIRGCTLEQEGIEKNQVKFLKKEKLLYRDIAWVSDWGGLYIEFKLFKL